MTPGVTHERRAFGDAAGGTAKASGLVQASFIAVDLPPGAMVRPMMSRLPSLLLVACVAARRRPVAVPRLGTPHPTSANCTLHRVSQNLDHFDFTTNATFEQRVFVHADHWAPGGPIFLYCGNEDDVTLYVNATGLMWEHAAAFGAMLVFVERRSKLVDFPQGLRIETCQRKIRHENQVRAADGVIF